MQPRWKKITPVSIVLWRQLYLKRRFLYIRNEVWPNCEGEKLKTCLGGGSSFKPHEKKALLLFPPWVFHRQSASTHGGQRAGSGKGLKKAEAKKRLGYKTLYFVCFKLNWKLVTSCQHVTEEVTFHRQVTTLCRWSTQHTSGYPQTPHETRRVKEVSYGEGAWEIPKRW